MPPPGPWLRRTPGCGSGFDGRAVGSEQRREERLPRPELHDLPQRPLVEGTIAVQRDRADHGPWSRLDRDLRSCTRPAGAADVLVSSSVRDAVAWACPRSRKKRSTIARSRSSWSSTKGRPGRRFSEGSRRSRSPGSRPANATVVHLVQPAPLHVEDDGQAAVCWRAAVVRLRLPVALAAEVVSTRRFESSSRSSSTAPSRSIGTRSPTRAFGNGSPSKTSSTRGPRTASILRSTTGCPSRRRRHQIDVCLVVRPWHATGGLRGPRARVPTVPSHGRPAPTPRCCSSFATPSNGSPTTETLPSVNRGPAAITKTSVAFVARTRVETPGGRRVEIARLPERVGEQVAHFLCPAPDATCEPKRSSSAARSGGRRGHGLRRTRCPRPPARDARRTSGPRPPDCSRPRTVMSSNRWSATSARRVRRTSAMSSGRPTRVSISGVSDGSSRTWPADTTLTATIRPADQRVQRWLCERRSHEDGQRRRRSRQGAGERRASEDVPHPDVEREGAILVLRHDPRETVRLVVLDQDDLIL